jgi:DNA-directed RNA polymerase subunit RPC12/RpoP
MFFLWGKKSGDEVLDKGFINCPHCRKRQPAVLTKYVESTHIYFIPISTTESPEQVRCEECGGYFANNEQTAFGHQEKEPDWNCFKCKKPIPHSRVDCPHCGFRFTA